MSTHPTLISRTHHDMTAMFPRLAILLLLPTTLLQAAQLRIAGVFTDHAVLQRDQPATIWGWADPDEKITVTFASQSKPATADASGSWRVKLDPMPASAEGRDLVVQSELKGRQSKLTDIVVGDVWLCSGQSNMHFRMRTVANAEQEIAAADQPNLRFLAVEHQFDQKPCADITGSWQRVSPATAADCSAVAYYFGREMVRSQGVPVGLVISSVGGTRIESWMRPETLAKTGESRSLVEKWSKVSPEEFRTIATVYREFQRQRDEVHPQAVKDAKAKGTPPPPEPKMPPQRCHDCPSALHNGMIAPLESCTFKGVIWYQGESNSSQPAAYEKLLPAMISDWRRVWGSGLPFLFVQLAPYRDTHPAFREAQFHIWQKTPRTAMAVITDVGDAGNIHPTRKQPVGERLALAARALAHGEQVEYSGPVHETLKIDGARAILSFSHAGRGLVARDGPLKGFTLAGSDGKHLPAKAVIEGSTVVVTCDGITTPAAVRYGWAMMPDCNLFNAEGLPAVPFRTDSTPEPARPSKP